MIKNTGKTKMEWEGSRTVFKGKKLDLILVPVKRSQETVEIEIIVHLGSSVILPIMPDSKVILIRNHRRTIQENLLELPAGTITPCEAPKTCARRELAEETGFKAKSMELLGAFYSAPGYSTEILYSYMATDLEAVGQSLEPDEEISVEYHPMSEIHEMIIGGVIRDAKTLSTFLLYWGKYGFKQGRTSGKVSF